MNINLVLPPIVCDIDFFIAQSESKLEQFSNENPEDLEEGEIVPDEHQYGIFKCKRCHREVKEDSYSHKQHCKPFSCPNACGSTIKMDKKELRAHLIGKCKSVVVTCTCCTKMILRTDEYFCQKVITSQSSKVALNQVTK